MTLQMLLVEIIALVPYLFFRKITILVHTFLGYSQFSLYILVTINLIIVIFNL